MMRIRRRALSLTAVLVVAVASGLTAFAQGGNPGFTPSNWKPGNKVPSQGGEVQITLAKIGPPTWEYFIAGFKCPTCKSERFPPTLDEVAIVSNFVPVQCGNTVKKMISSSTRGWTEDNHGQAWIAPKGGLKEMGLVITCDAKDDPIYLQVKWTEGIVSGVARVLLPGPVNPQ
jgi:hypothetical protein